MKNSRIRLLLRIGSHLVPAAVLLNIDVASGQATQPSPEEIARGAIIARVEALQNLSAQYDRIDELSPDPKLVGTFKLANGAVVSTHAGSQQYVEQFSFFHGNAMWSTTMSKQTAEYYRQQAVSVPVQQIADYSNGRLESMEMHPDWRNPAGTIDDRCRPSFFEVGLGIRADITKAEAWLTPERLGAMAFRFNSQHHPVLTENQPNGSVYHFTFNPEEGYALEDYDLVYAQSNYKFQEIVASDFQMVDNIPLPFTITVRFLTLNKVERARQTAKLKSYKLNDPENAEKGYHIKWPKGVMVSDRRTDSAVIVQQEGEILTEHEFDRLLRAQEADRAQRLSQPTSSPSATQP
jgi:hypothetical protein